LKNFPFQSPKLVSFSFYNLPVKLLSNLHVLPGTVKINCDAQTPPAGTEYDMQKPNQTSPVALASLGIFNVSPFNLT
jgi:hypothetical protein